MMMHEDNEMMHVDALMHDVKMHMLMMHEIYNA